MATQVDLARRLLGAAENDELMAKSVLPVEGVTDAGVGNLAQQAVEKAMKAALAAKDVEFPFTHNLRYLRDLCNGSGRSTASGTTSRSPTCVRSLRSGACQEAGRRTSSPR